MKIKPGNIYFWQSTTTQIPNELILIIQKHGTIDKFWEYEYLCMFLPITKTSLLHERYIKTLEYIGNL